MKAQLTVLIPCKNERRNIRACIESVRAIADEILVADSGSTDGTLDIVRDLGGCRIIEREYINSANFKNWAIPQARHEWVLVLDADERIPRELAVEIRKFLEAPPSGKDGFWIDRINHFLGYRIKHCGWNSDAVIRLFRRTSKYKDRWVHSQVDLPMDRTGKLKQPMLHYTSWNSDDYLFKRNRYSAWGAMNLHAEGRKPSVLKMISKMPLRFFHLYFLRLGFLDGVPGFQICMYTAFYTFVKQAKLWEKYNAIPQPDPEVGRLTHDQNPSMPPSTSVQPVNSQNQNQEQRLPAA